MYGTQQLSFRFQNLKFSFEAMSSAKMAHLPPVGPALQTTAPSGFVKRTGVCWPQLNTQTGKRPTDTDTDTDTACTRLIMPPKHTGKEVPAAAPRQQAPIHESEDDWVDEDAASSDRSSFHSSEEYHNREHDYEDEEEEEEEDDEEDEDEDDALLRMSEQHRRSSESRKNALRHHPQDAEANDDEEMGITGHDEDAAPHRNSEDEDDLEQEHDDEEEEEGAGDEESLTAEMLTNMLHSFANATPGGSGNSLAENMARIFPGAMGMYDTIQSQGSSASTFRDLIARLKLREDSFIAMEILNEISERLLMLNTVTAQGSLPVDDLSVALVGVLNDPTLQEELELQLVACRCIYNFLEVNLDFVQPLAHAGAIEALQSKLLEISYIDLAEQVLQALFLMSKVCGTSIFRKGCLTATLQYLDFFTIHAQRKAVDIVANSVKYIREYEFHLVEEIFPLLQRIVVEFNDAQELESAWLAITRIIKNFKSSDLLSKLIDDELLNKIISVISSSDNALSTNLKLINTLVICAKNEELSKSIIKSNKIVQSLKSALSKYSKGSESSLSIETLMGAPKHLIVSILDLLMNLLPAEQTSLLTTKSSKLKKNYSNISESYIEFSNEVFELLINIYQSTVVFDIRRHVLVSMIRIISSVKNIKDLKHVNSITGLLASIVIQNKSLIRSENQDTKPYFNLLCSLMLTLLLVGKDADFFLGEFEREGLLSDTSSLLEVLRKNHHLLTDDEDDEMCDDVEGEEEEDEDEEEDNGEDQNDEDEEPPEDWEDEIDDDEENEDDYDDDYDYDYEEQNFSISAHNRTKPTFKSLSLSKLLSHLISTASQIEQIYLSKKASGSSKLGHLKLLDELSGDLSDEELIKSYKYEDWIRTWKNLSMALSQDVFIISSFELISSGIIDVLFKLFSNVHYGGEGTIARFTFLDVFQGDKFKLLVKKLQESLTRSEMFEIVQCGLKTDENRATSLGKQLKLKLVVLNDDEQLFRGMSQMVILVHAIASFSNISSFLKRRVENPFGFATRVSAAHNSSEKNDWHVEFLLDNEVVPFETTIYGALYKQAQNKNKNFDTYAFWNEIHEIRFRKAEGALTALEFDDRYPEVEDDFSSNASSGSETQITTSILNLLKILHDFAPDATSFLNFKLTAKLNRQLEEPLIVASGILPNWSISITRKYPFLFPLETRIFFLQSTSFGYSRLIQLWNNRANQEQDGNNDNSNGNNDNNEALSLGRPTRHKVRVSRNHLLKSCYKVLDKLGSNPSVIEIEFTDEVGTGLGPTLEFYASVSHLFAKKKLGIWRQDQEDYENKSEEYVQNKAGLFPEPLNSNDPEYSTKLDHFKYIGKFVARALLDNRIVDMNFNRLFFELAESEINDPDFKISPIVAFEKFKYVDKRLYDSLKFMRQNKSQIDDLEITFTLPGRDDYELIENGADIQVTSENIDEYIDKVVDVSIGSGVKEQIEAFIVGFSEVFPFFSMTIFSADELVQLLGRSEEDWSYETLISSIHAAHGYSLDSKSVQSLIASMVKFDDTKRRLFLQFLTGSPRLPIGGFKKLKPDFTVVLKRPEDGLKADDYLPSVMTCANYLKLPDYSSAEMFEQRLDQAIKEGAGSFLLS